MSAYVYHLSSIRFISVQSFCVKKNILPVSRVLTQTDEPTGSAGNSEINLWHHVSFDMCVCVCAPSFCIIVFLGGIVDSFASTLVNKMMSAT